MHEAETNRQFAYWSDATHDTEFNPKAAAVLHLNSEVRHFLPTHFTRILPPFLTSAQ